MRARGAHRRARRRSSTCGPTTTIRSPRASRAATGCSGPRCTATRPGSDTRNGAPTMARARRSSTCRGPTPPRRSPTRLRALIDEHGPRAVGLYLGNPNAFNAMAGAGAFQFIKTIGSDRVFSSASQDCSNKYATAELLYGVAQANPIADLERTELVLDDRHQPARQQDVVPQRRRSGEGAARHPRPGWPRRVRQPAAHRARHRRDAAGAARHRPVPARRDAARDRSHRRLPAGRARRRRRRASTRCERSCGRTPPPRSRRSSGSPPRRSSSSRSAFADGRRRVDPRVDRPQHGTPGLARLLAGADAGAAHRQPRPTGRQLLRRARLRDQPRAGRPDRGVVRARPSGVRTGRRWG